MPDVKVYIRQENIDKWNAMANKANWLNTLLKNSDDTREYGKTINTPVGPAVTVLSETLPPIGMACCKLPSPCKHWKHNDLNQTWTNTLTGEVKDDEV